jgi:hypothetical protein
MLNLLLSTKWIPNPPTLQRAIEAGHVGVTDNTEGRFYMLSKQCPNPGQVKRAIALRNRLEIAWAGVVACCAVGGIAWLAQWSNTV